MLSRTPSPGRDRSWDRALRGGACLAIAVACALRAAPAARAVSVTDASGAAVEIRSTNRIVSVSPSVTEILFALGAGDRVVGVDLTSARLPDAKQRTQVGYQRTLEAAGVLAVAPSLVVGTEDAGPPAVLDALRAANVAVLVLSNAATTDNARARILTLAELTDTRRAGDSLVAVLDRGLENAKQRAAAGDSLPRVLFLYTRGNTPPFLAGAHTPAEAIITLAGGVNAVTGFDGYRELTAEAVAAANPDVILLTDDAWTSLGGESGVRQQPGIELTPAAKNGRLLHYDAQYLLGFGPRLGAAASELEQALRAPPAKP